MISSSKRSLTSKVLTTIATAALLGGCDNRVSELRNMKRVPIEVEYGDTLWHLSDDKLKNPDRYDPRDIIDAIYEMPENQENRAIRERDPGNLQPRSVIYVPSNK